MVLLIAGIVVWPLLGTGTAAIVQGTGFPDALADKARHIPSGNGADLNQACQELRTIPGVRNCGTHIGQALLMDEVYGIYFGENWISVDPSVDYDETLAKVQETVDGYPGLYRDVQTYLKERIREVLTGSSHPIVIRIYGQDLEVLREKAAEVEERLVGDRRSYRPARGVPA